MNKWLIAAAVGIATGKYVGGFWAYVGYSNLSEVNKLTAAKKKVDKKTQPKNKPGSKNKAETKGQTTPKTERQASQKSEAEIMAELRRLMAKTPVYEFVTQFMATLSSLAYQRLGVYQEGAGVAVDLEQARTAIDCYEALLKLVADKINKEEAEALKNVLSGLQLTFVKQKQQS